MHKRFLSTSSSWLKSLLLISAVSIAGSATATANSDSVATLRAKYGAIQEQLQQNQFKQPLVLDSSEAPDRLKGDIYAVVDYPFDTVSTGLNNPDHWCDVMVLHVNTKYCHAMVEPSGTTLNVNIGKKTPEELTQAKRVNFKYTVAAATPEYLEILLNAKNGPMGTSDYRILLEVVPLSNTKSFLHLTYSYATGLSARLAMQVYLGTVGSGKVGFTVVGKLPDGRPDYVAGMRGLMERNTMRYYLAIDAFLEATSAAPAAQSENRMQHWFTAVERYPRQLHEMDRDQYVAMKRSEYLRQQAVQ